MVGLLIRHGNPDDTSTLVRALMWTPLAAVYASPLGVALDTAQQIARDHGLDVHVRAALTDLDDGDGVGHSRRELQHRIVNELMALARSHQAETIAIVTHAGPIRYALAAFSENDEVLASEIEPAHVSAIGIESDVRRVLSVNVPAMEMSA
jgi:broad specificity phosphatase PhoE